MPQNKKIIQYTTEKHQISKSHFLWNFCDTLCYKAKNLYNQGLYRIRQEFFKTEKYLNYNALQKQMQKEKVESYTGLNAKNSQLILQQLDKNFKSFFQALKVYKKSPNKFLGRPRIPQYKDKKGRFAVYFNIQTLSQPALRKGFLKLSGTEFSLPLKNPKGKIKSCRIIPREGWYEIEIVYAEKIKKLKNPNKKIYAALDPGVTNLATVVTNSKDIQPVYISGGPLKSINQYYNKKRTELKSKQDTCTSKRGVKKIQKELNKLYKNRWNKVRDYLHKSSRVLTNFLVSSGVTNLVIGHNPEWKQEANMSKQSNQNFCSIPHDLFFRMLIYKCSREGVIPQDNTEAYTSKCSFLDLEDIKKQEIYKGHRTYRGLFKSSEGYKINADVNGAGNILRKAVDGAFDQWSKAELIEGFVVNPVCLATDPRFKSWQEVS